MTKVTILSSSMNKALISTQMKVKVDSQENQPSVLHPRTSFWGVNISRQDDVGEAEEMQQRAGV